MSSAKDVAHEFNQKYPGIGVWRVVIIEGFNCSSCASNLLLNEVILENNHGSYCARCSIEMYNNKVPKQQVIIKEEKQEYPPIDMSWTKLSNGECYFCGPVQTCEHLV